MGGVEERGRRGTSSKSDRRKQRKFDHD